MTAGKDSIVAVGMFDGVHIGHQFVLRELRRLGEQMGLRPVVVTFDRHPLALIRPEKVPGQLTSLDKKLELIRREGIDNVLVLEFDETLRRLTAAEFARKVLLPETNAKAVLIGYDNTFGSDRLEGSGAYRDALAPLGLRVYDCAKSAGVDVSSSIVRQTIRAGQLTTAKTLMGRPYTFGGEVVHGKQLGRKIGFPTANIATGPALLPPPGVYAARVADSSVKSIVGLPAMVNIGSAPTVNDSQSEISVEAHIIIPNQEIISEIPDGDSLTNVPFYGQHIELEPIGRLRDEKKFASVDELKAALKSDRQATLDLFNRL